MRRLLLAGMLLGLLSTGSGCAMCGSPWDYAYGGYGGQVPRDDQFNGRVNSAFVPAGGSYVPGETVSAPAPTAGSTPELDLEPSAEMINE